MCITVCSAARCLFEHFVATSWTVVGWCFLFPLALVLGWTASLQVYVYSSCKIISEQRSEGKTAFCLRLCIIQAWFKGQD